MATLPSLSQKGRRLAMNYKKIEITMLSIACAIMLCACSKQETPTTNDDTIKETTVNVSYDENDYYQDYSDGETIDLDKQSGDVEITKAGTYILTGTLSNGSILINASKEDTVRLVLDNAHITSSSFAAIYSSQAKKVIISLPEGTSNAIEDASTYTKTVEDDVTSAIFIKDDLTFNGNGTLTITANNNDAITSKDTLKLMEGTYDITAEDDGIVGRDFLYVHDGNYTLHVEGDGLKTTYDTDDSKGDMVIEAGTFNIAAGNDGFQAEHSLTIYDGTFDITTGGGSINSSTSSNVNQPGGFGMWNSQSTTSTDSASAKGIKTGSSLTIKGGTYDMDTSDDALHTNGDVTIDAGNFIILSGDDGIHADNQLIINGGTIDIQKSYEGLEAAVIDIYGGYIQVIASDDGINTGGGSDDVQQGHPGQDKFNTSESSYSLNIHGGTIQVDAAGDGLDSNGNIYINGGTTIVNGPTSGADGALDYDGECVITGGTLATIGMSTMAQAPSTTSTQNSIMINLSSTQSAGSILYLTDADGKIILGISPTKQYNNVVMSTPALTTDKTIQVYTNGSGGKINDSGLIESGITGGTLLEETTITTTLTTIGSTMGGMGNMGGERIQQGGQTPNGKMH